MLKIVVAFITLQYYVVKCVATRQEYQNNQDIKYATEWKCLSYP